MGGVGGKGSQPVGTQDLRTAITCFNSDVVYWIANSVETFRLGRTKTGQFW